MSRQQVPGSPSVAQEAPPSPCPPGQQQAPSGPGTAELLPVQRGAIVAGALLLLAFVVSAGAAIWDSATRPPRPVSVAELEMKAAAARSSKWESIHRSFPNGFYVPLSAHDVDHARGDFEAAVQDVTEAATPAPTSGVVRGMGCSNWVDIFLASSKQPSAQACRDACQYTAECVHFNYMTCPDDDDFQKCILFRGDCEQLENSCWDLYQHVDSKAADSTDGTASSTGRRGSFLVLGDWGWDEGTHGNINSDNCQRAIATSMLEKMQELGDVKFIINVGDSFYPAGVESRSDPKWDAHWRQRYASELRSVPWYTCYGNHDYQHDPCACSDNPRDCAQYNNNASDTNWFYFPDFNWFREHPELGLEVISLDMNQLCHDDCQYSSCEDTCKEHLSQRANDAVELFKARSSATKAKNLLVFSHYPTDYLGEYPELMDALKGTEGADGTQHHIEYFGGHRHNVDQETTASISPNNNWLVGGGGGWGTDGDKQGFVVGEIADDFTITTYSVLVDNPCGEGTIQFK